MMRILVTAGLAAVLALPLTVAAQTNNPGESPYTFNHGEVTAFGHYFRFDPSGSSKATNFLGVGGLVGFSVHPNVSLEGQMTYDFARNYTSISGSGGTVGGTSTTVVSRVRPITGLFGPKFQFGTSGPFRVFVTGKVGFVDFTSSNASPSGSSFGNSLNGFGGSGTHFSAYPGAGFEAYFGPLGIRAEAGDDIYWSNGTNNNLMVMFGPSFRF